MENFKIEIFSKEHAGEKLSFEKVQGAELLMVVHELENLLGLRDFKDSTDFFKSIDQKLEKVTEADEVDLSYTLNDIKLDIPLEGRCYLIWNFPEDIDRFDLNYLIKNWDYVWYGDSDDAAVLLIEGKLLMLITHFGVVKYLKT